MNARTWKRNASGTSGRTRRHQRFWRVLKRGAWLALGLIAPLSIPALGADGVTATPTGAVATAGSVQCTFTTEFFGGINALHFSCSSAGAVIDSGDTPVSSLTVSTYAGIGQDYVSWSAIAPQQIYLIIANGILYQGSFPNAIPPGINPADCQSLVLPYTAFQSASTSFPVAVQSVPAGWAPEFVSLSESSIFASSSARAKQFSAMLGTLQSPDFYLPKVFLGNGPTQTDDSTDPALPDAHTIYATLSVENANPDNLTTLTAGSLLIQVCGRIPVVPGILTVGTLVSGVCSLHSSGFHVSGKTFVSNEVQANCPLPGVPVN